MLSEFDGNIAILNQLIGLSRGFDKHSDVERYEKELKEIERKRETIRTYLKVLVNELNEIVK